MQAVERPNTRKTRIPRRLATLHFAPLQPVISVDLEICRCPRSQFPSRFTGSFIELLFRSDMHRSASHTPSMMVNAKKYLSDRPQLLDCPRCRVSLSLLLFCFPFSFSIWERYPESKYTGRETTLLNSFVPWLFGGDWQMSLLFF